MRRLIVAMLLVPGSPILGAPVNLFDSFEYADGVGDPAYAAHWSVVAGQNRYPIVERIYQVDVTDPGALHGTKVAMAATPAPAGGYGITRPLSPVEPTDESPLVYKADWHGMATSTNRYLVSFAMELSQGDVHAPPLGSAPLATPIPVIALAVGYGTGDFQYRFFDGTTWQMTPIKLWAGYRQWNWQHLTMTLTDLGDPGTQTGKHVSIHMQNEDLSVIGDEEFDLTMPAGAWTAGETFDRISLRAFDGFSFNSIIDSVSLTGGEIVPEPATLALLALSVSLVLRRRGK